jgi:predicted branched-subunit amino acid permease
MWAAGTALGISMGNILPARIVSALSVALFGMFLAVIVPPSRKDKAVGAAVIVSFACSLAAGKLPVISDLSQGNRTIILTVLISALFAVLFPRSEEAAEKEIMEEAEKISEDVEMYSRAEGGDADE